MVSPLLPLKPSHKSAKKIDHYLYNLHDVLGQGSFSTVFIGKDIQTSIPYAIKVINTSSIKDPVSLVSLLQEIKILKSLKNPNIIELHDVLSTPNNIYLIMEYCPNGDLKQYLQKNLRFSENKALEILKQILNGYQELYKNGIIHRDLKPENILLTSDFNFKIADFGFAKALDNFSFQTMNSLVGTPLYMSPQILKQEKYTTKSDVWSIGIIYYEMIYGKTPWNIEKTNGFFNKFNNFEVEFNAGIEISEISKDFILGCLRFEENERFSWDEVYSNRIFADCFKFKEKLKFLNKEAYKLQAKLSRIINGRSINIKKLFESIDCNRNEMIEIDEFSRLLKKIDENLDRELIEYIFNGIDLNGDRVICFEEFDKWIGNCNIIMKKQNSQNDFKKTINSNDDKYVIESPIMDRELISILKKKLKEISLTEICTQLNINEKAINKSAFYKIMYEVWEKIVFKNIDKIFEEIDEDKDNLINIVDIHIFFYK